MDERTVFLNGDFLPLADARVSPMDRGFLYGDGLFETLRAYDGVAFRMDRHVERLARGLDRIDITLPFPASDLGDVVAKLIERNRVSDAYIRITVSRGMHTGPITLEPSDAPTVFAYAAPVVTPSADLYKRGAAVAIVDFRERPGFSTSDLKSLSFQGNLQLLTETRRAGLYDAIAINARGEVAEGAVSNVFVVKDGRLRTPPEAAVILPGVTRGVVMELAERAGVEVVCETLTADDLSAADEVFLTNSLIEVLPVREVDSCPVANAPGELTLMIHGHYREEVERWVQAQQSAT